MANKFSRQVDRIMTPDEVRAKCAEMGLSEELADFLEEKFISVADEYGEEFPDTTGEDGRIAWGQSWESAMDDLAQAMGFDTQSGDYDRDSNPELTRVWEAFFQE